MHACTAVCQKAPCQTVKNQAHSFSCYQVWRHQAQAGRQAGRELARKLRYLKIRDNFLKPSLDRIIFLLIQYCWNLYLCNDHMVLCLTVTLCLASSLVATTTSITTPQHSTIKVGLGYRKNMPENICECMQNFKAN